MHLTAIHLFLRSLWKHNVLIIFTVIALAVGSSSFSNQSQLWVGRWQITAFESGAPTTFVLTSDRKAYLLAPDRNAAIELPIEKVSDDAALPADIEIISWSNYQENLAISAAETEAQNYVAAMNRAQQAYRLENPRFASDIASLEIGIPPETSNYRYQVAPQSDETQSVMMTATALQPELRSYTGAVFVADSTMKAIVCVSDQPSTTPPAMPTAPAGENAQPRCAIGSSVLR